ncbi:MAG: redoxin domain-containing protein [Bacteroidales bacterium]|nr:redoxin domain-containing protein [Bacteroidales bacterium]
MRRILLLLIGLLFGVSNLVASTDQQTSKWTQEELQMVLQTLDGIPAQQLIPKLSQWYAAEKDSTAQQLFIKTAFNHYADSPIMGYEHVALYLADEFLLNGRVSLSSTEEFQVSWYTQVTRSNALGATAPDLIFYNPQGYPVQLNRLPGDYLVLLFIDDQCPICQQEYEALAGWAEQWIQAPTCELSMVRCYVGDDLERWSTYQKEHPLPQSDSLTIWDAWDPDFNTGFQLYYGVISTPKMFLINSQDRIVGRNLNTAALAQLLTQLTRTQSPQEVLVGFFEELFEITTSSSGDHASDALLVQYTIDRIYEQCQTDDASFRQVCYELYQYLKNHPDYLLQEGAVYVGEQYICGIPQRWLGYSYEDHTFDEDFLEEVAFAARMFRRNPLGAVAQDLKLTRTDGSAFRISDSPSAYTILYFYKTDCAACEAVTHELQRILPQFRKEDVTLLAIYTGRKGRSWKKYAISNFPDAENLADLNGNSRLFERYDLSAVPTLYLLDEEKRVIAKDITPFALEEIINALYPQ